MTAHRQGEFHDYTGFPEYGRGFFSYRVSLQYYAFMNIMWGGGIRALKTEGGGVAKTEAKKSGEY